MSRRKRVVVAQPGARALVARPLVGAGEVEAEVARRPDQRVELEQRRAPPPAPVSGRSGRYAEPRRLQRTRSAFGAIAAVGSICSSVSRWTTSSRSVGRGASSSCARTAIRRACAFVSRCIASDFYPLHYPRAVAIRDERALREAIGSPTEVVRGKIADRLNELTRQFVERSPFVCVATTRPDGGLDVSPRGDPAASSGSSTSGRCCCRSGRQPARGHAHEPARGPAHRAALPDPRRRGHVPRQRPRRRSPTTPSCSRRARSRARCRGSGSSSRSTRPTRSARRR